MMESVLLVERLKQAIQDDFKGMTEELDKANQEKKQLEDKNDTLNKLNKELKDDNVSLTQTLKELKEKYDHLHAKLKRKQEEIKKKDQWWDRYRFTAETMIKKLRTQGSFSPDVLHEVSRDLVDIMEEASNKENSRSPSSQDSEVKNPTKLTTSKDGKKRVRYTEVSPENLGTNCTGRVQSKEMITRTKTDEKSNKDDESSTRKQNIIAEHPKDLTGENKYLLGSKKKQHTGDIACSWPGRNGKDKENGKRNNLRTASATKKSYEEHGNYPDDDETCGYPSLTSTPMFSTSNKKPLLSSTALHDISVIPKDVENVKNPSEMDGMLGAGANPDDIDNSSPLTPAVPTIFENLLTRRTSLTSNSSSTNKSKNNAENFATKNKNMGHFEKLPGSKDLKIEKLKPTEKDNLPSPSILKNLELRLGAANDDTIDYPAASEDHIGSQSILAVDLKPVCEEGCVDLKSRMNGMKRKRSSSEEEMGITQGDIKEEKPTQPDKKISRRNSRKSTFKMAIKPHPSTKTNLKEAQILPDPCSIVLLSDDEEEAIKMESSSVDMFANSEKSLSKDLSNDRDVIDVREDKGQSIKTAVPSTSYSSNLKNQDLDLVKQAEIENDLLDAEFPGFRKPDELNYKNIKVVRKKGERAKLSGFSCRDCEQYYGEMTETERKKKLKHCSRHRAKYSPPPSTPPGFWNLSFPSTQEVIEGGMMVTGDQVPVQKPRRPRKKRLLKSMPKQPT